MWKYHMSTMWSSEDRRDSMDRIKKGYAGPNNPITWHNPAARKSRCFITARNMTLCWTMQLNHFLRWLINVVFGLDEIGITSLSHVVPWTMTIVPTPFYLWIVSPETVTCVGVSGINVWPRCGEKSECWRHGWQTDISQRQVTTWMTDWLHIDLNLVLLGSFWRVHFGSKLTQIGTKWDMF